MDQLILLQTQIDELKSRLPAISQEVNNIQQELDKLKNNSDMQKPHWIESTNGTLAVRKYSCSYCGYLSTFQGMRCPSCLSTMR